MKVVLDANVVVAAFAARGLCEALFEVCLDGHDIVTSENLLEEIARSLRKKIKLPSATVNPIIQLIRENSTLLAPHQVSRTLCRDPQDLHVLGLAVAAHADALITGDKDLLDVRGIQGCRILSPREFWELLRKKERGT